MAEYDYQAITPTSVQNEVLTRKLRASDARLRAAIECLPCDFWMIGQDGRYVMQNSISREYWGDVLGKRPEDLSADPETFAIWQANNARAFGGDVVREEVTLRVKGESRHFLNIIAPVMDGGRVTGILGINFDITERKRAEEQLQRTNQELQRANRLLDRVGRTKDQMVAMISHELRTPLVTGLGYLEMLLDGKLGPITQLARAKMHIAQRNLRRLSGMIDAVLKYQQVLGACAIEGGCREPFSLPELVQEVLTDLAQEGARRVECVIESELPLVMGDRELIRMALVNLISNGLIHGGRRASISLVARRVGSSGVRVTIKDSGAGVPSSLLRSVFEPFVRGSSGNGYGLGLAIVRAILASHHSEPVMETLRGRGTMVSFVLEGASSALVGRQ